jgi:hypothetical protein
MQLQSLSVKLTHMKKNKNMTLEEKSYKMPEMSTSETLGAARMCTK